MSRLIYHTEESYERGESPFDRAIRETADSEEVWIVCPYIGPSYLKSIIKNVDEWRILTDVEAWIGTFGGESRQEIQEFIEEYGERIHHFHHVHAKVVLSEDTAVVGSANLTEKGVTRRTEMGVRFDDEEKIAELREWFNWLWSESSPVDPDELDELVRTLPSASSTHLQPTASLSLNAPQVRARFTKEIEPSTHHTVEVEEDDDRRMTADRFFGGVDDRIENLRSMLDYIAEEFPEESALWSWLRSNVPDVEKESTIKTYVGFIRKIGLINKDGDTYLITNAGDYFRKSEDLDFLYRLLMETVKGFETILVLLSDGSKTEEQIQAALREQFPDYSLSTGVIKRHLEWLLAIGYIEKSDGGYTISDKGLETVGVA